MASWRFRSTETAVDTSVPKTMDSAPKTTCGRVKYQATINRVAAAASPRPRLLVSAQERDALDGAEHLIGDGSFVCQAEEVSRAERG